MRVSRVYLGVCLWMSGRGGEGEALSDVTGLPPPSGHCSRALGTLAHPTASAHRMVQEQCCHNQLEELYCTTGINLANEQDSCAPPRGSNASLEAVFVKVSTRGLGRPPPCTPKSGSLSL